MRKKADADDTIPTIPTIIKLCDGVPQKIGSKYNYIGGTDEFSTTSHISFSIGLSPDCIF